MREELSDDGRERVCAPHDVGVGVEGEAVDDGGMRGGEFVTVLQRREECVVRRQQSVAQSAKIGTDRSTNVKNSVDRSFLLGAWR